MSGPEENPSWQQFVYLVEGPKDFDKSLLAGAIKASSRHKFVFLSQEEVLVQARHIIKTTNEAELHPVFSKLRLHDQLAKDGKAVDISQELLSDLVGAIIEHDRQQGVLTKMAKEETDLPIELSMDIEPVVPHVEGESPSQTPPSPKTLKSKKDTKDKEKEPVTSPPTTPKASSRPSSSRGRHGKERSQTEDGLKTSEKPKKRSRKAKIADPEHGHGSTEPSKQRTGTVSRSDSAADDAVSLFDDGPTDGPDVYYLLSNVVSSVGELLALQKKGVPIDAVVYVSEPGTPHPLDRPARPVAPVPEKEEGPRHVTFPGLQASQSSLEADPNTDEKKEDGGQDSVDREKELKDVKDKGEKDEKATGRGSGRRSKGGRREKRGKKDKDEKKETPPAVPAGEVSDGPDAVLRGSVESGALAEDGSGTPALDPNTQTGVQLQLQMAAAPPSIHSDFVVALAKELHRPVSALDDTLWVQLHYHRDATEGRGEGGSATKDRDAGGGVAGGRKGGKRKKKEESHLKGVLKASSEPTGASDEAAVSVDKDAAASGYDAASLFEEMVKALYQVVTTRIKYLAWLASTNVVAMPPPCRPDLQHYRTRMQQLPGSQNSVPLLLHCLLEQVEVTAARAGQPRQGRDQGRGRMGLSDIKQVAQQRMTDLVEHFDSCLALNTTGRMPKPKTSSVPSVSVLPTESDADDGDVVLIPAADEIALRLAPARATHALTCTTLASAPACKCGYVDALGIERRMGSFVGTPDQPSAAAVSSIPTLSEARELIDAAVARQQAELMAAQQFAGDDVSLAELACGMEVLGFEKLYLSAAEPDEDDDAEEEEDGDVVDSSPVPSPDDGDVLRGSSSSADSPAPSIDVDADVDGAQSSQDASPMSDSDPRPPADDSDTDYDDTHGPLPQCLQHVAGVEELDSDTLAQVLARRMETKPILKQHAGLVFDAKVQERSAGVLLSLHPSPSSLLDRVPEPEAWQAEVKSKLAFRQWAQQESERERRETEQKKVERSMRKKEKEKGKERISADADAASLDGAVPEAVEGDVTLQQPGEAEQLDKAPDTVATAESSVAATTPSAHLLHVYDVPLTRTRINQSEQVVVPAPGPEAAQLLAAPPPSALKVNVTLSGVGAETTQHVQAVIHQHRPQMTCALRTSRAVDDAAEVPTLAAASAKGAGTGTGAGQWDGMLLAENDPTTHHHMHMDANAVFTASYPDGAALTVSLDASHAADVETEKVDHQQHAPAAGLFFGEEDGDADADAAEPETKIHTLANASFATAHDGAYTGLSVYCEGRTGAVHQMKKPSGLGQAGAVGGAARVAAEGEELQRHVLNTGTVLRVLKDGSLQLLHPDGTTATRAAPAAVVPAQGPTPAAAPEADVPAPTVADTAVEADADPGWLITKPDGTRTCTGTSSQTLQPVTVARTTDPETGAEVCTRQDMVMVVSGTFQPSTTSTSTSPVPEYTKVAWHADGTAITTTITHAQAEVIARARSASPSPRDDVMGVDVEYLHDGDADDELMKGVDDEDEGHERGSPVSQSGVAKLITQAHRTIHVQAPGTADVVLSFPPVTIHEEGSDDDAQVQLQNRQRAQEAESIVAILPCGARVEWDAAKGMRVLRQSRTTGAVAGGNVLPESALRIAGTTVTLEAPAPTRGATTAATAHPNSPSASVGAGHLLVADLATGHLSVTDAQGVEYVVDGRTGEVLTLDTSGMDLDDDENEEEDHGRDSDAVAAADGDALAVTAASAADLAPAQPQPMAGLIDVSSERDEGELMMGMGLGDSPTQPAQPQHQPPSPSAAAPDVSGDSSHSKITETPKPKPKRSTVPSLATATSMRSASVVPPSFFVVRPDGSGHELLSERDVAELVAHAKTGGECGDVVLVEDPLPTTTVQHHAGANGGMVITIMERVLASANLPAPPRMPTVTALIPTKSDYGTHALARLTTDLAAGSSSGAGPADQTLPDIVRMRQIQTHPILSSTQVQSIRGVMSRVRRWRVGDDMDAQALLAAQPEPRQPEQGFRSGPLQVRLPNDNDDDSNCQDAIGLGKTSEGDVRDFTTTSSKTLAGAWREAMTRGEQQDMDKYEGVDDDAAKEAPSTPVYHGSTGSAWQAKAEQRRLEAEEHDDMNLDSPSAADPSTVRYFFTRGGREFVAHGGDGKQAESVASPSAESPSTQSGPKPTKQARVSGKGLATQLQAIKVVQQSGSGGPGLELTKSLTIRAPEEMLGDHVKVNARQLPPSRFAPPPQQSDQQRRQLQTSHQVQMRMNTGIQQQQSPQKTASVMKTMTPLKEPDDRAAAPLSRNNVKMLLKSTRAAAAFHTKPQSCVDFGEVPLNTTRVKTVRFTNSGGSAGRLQTRRGDPLPQGVTLKAEYLPGPVASGMTRNVKLTLTVKKRVDIDIPIPVRAPGAEGLRVKAVVV